MATLEDIILAGKGRSGSNQAWEVGGSHMGITNDGRDIIVKHLWHYTTLMLSWREDDPADENYLDYSLGHGSVSDQGGMNRAFQLLGIPLRYTRAGGASIEPIDPSLAKPLRENALYFHNRRKLWAVERRVRKRGVPA